MTVRTDITDLRPWLIKRVRDYLIECWIRKEWPVNSRTRARRLGVIGRSDPRYKTS